MYTVFRESPARFIHFWILYTDEKDKKKKTKNVYKYSNLPEVRRFSPPLYATRYRVITVNGLNRANFKIRASPLIPSTKKVITFNYIYLRATFHPIFHLPLSLESFLNRPNQSSFSVLHFSEISWSLQILKNSLSQIWKKKNTLYFFSLIIWNKSVNWFAINRSSSSQCLKSCRLFSVWWKSNGYTNLLFYSIVQFQTIELRH